MQNTWQKLRKFPQNISFFQKRERVIDTLRVFFKSQGFLEVDTPLLVSHPGMEPNLEVFETKLLDINKNETQAFLLTSPEYALKKLIVSGVPKLFTICKSFRNGEGVSTKHNPEFTILEWYRSPADYFDIMADCQELLIALCKEFYGGTTLVYQGKTYDLSVCERITVSQAFKKYSGIDLNTLLDTKLLLEAGRKRGYTVDAHTTWELMFNQILLNEIEPHLGKERPTILYNYPASQASLAKLDQSDPRFAQRFEIFLAGIELGNAFSELSDPDEQLARFLSEREERANLGKKVYDIDSDYIDALRTGLPKTGGIAVGVDRLCMLFANAPSIQDVIAFPCQELFDISSLG